MPNWLTKLATVDSIEDILINLITKKIDIRTALVNFQALGNPPEICQTISQLSISNPESSHILNLVSLQLNCNNPGQPMYNNNQQPQQTPNQIGEMSNEPNTPEEQNQI